MNATKTNYDTDLDILYVSKEYFGTGLKCLDMLIISTIEEYEKREEECCLTNKALSNMFHESEATIKRAISKLEKHSIIKRNTFFISGNGRNNKRRTLTLRPKNQWKINWRSNGGKI